MARYVLASPIEVASSPAPAARANSKYFRAKSKSWVLRKMLAASTKLSAEIGCASPMRASANANATCCLASSNFSSRTNSRAIASRASTRFASTACMARVKRSIAASVSPVYMSASPVASSTPEYSAPSFSASRT